MQSVLGLLNIYGKELIESCTLLLRSELDCSIRCLNSYNCTAVRFVPNLGTCQVYRKSKLQMAAQGADPGSITVVYTIPGQFSV